MRGQSEDPFRCLCGGPSRYCGSYLQLKQSETPSSSCSSIVLDSRALDNWLQSVDRSWSNLCGFGETGCSSSVLSSRLVEMDSDPSLPVLVKMVVRNLVIVFDGLRFELVYGFEKLACCDKEVYDKDGRLVERVLER